MLTSIHVFFIVAVILCETFKEIWLDVGEEKNVIKGRTIEGY